MRKSDIYIIIIVITMSIFGLACSKQNESISMQEREEEPEATSILIQLTQEPKPEHGWEAEKSEQTPTDAPKRENRKETETESVLAERFQSDPINGEYLQTISLRSVEYDKKGLMLTTFQNEKLDFSKVIISLEDMQTGEQGLTLSICYAYPQEWTTLEANSVFHSIGLRFFQNEKELMVFRLIQRELDLQQYRGTLTYQSDCLENNSILKNGIVSVIPFIQSYTKMTGREDESSSKWKTIDLEDGGKCIVEERADAHAFLTFQLSNKQFTLLSKIHLDIPLTGIIPLQESTKEALILPVTVFIPDWNKNKAAGYYDDHLDYDYEYGSFHNTTADFSNIGLSIERAEASDAGIRFLAHILFPSEWSQEVCQNIVPNLNVSILLDGKPAVIRGLNYFYFSRPEEARTRNNQTGEQYWPNNYFLISDNTPYYLDELRSAETITFQFVHRYATALEMNGRIHDLTKGESVEATGFIVEQWQEEILQEISFPIEELFAVYQREP